MHNEQLIIGWEVFEWYQEATRVSLVTNRVSCRHEQTIDYGVLETTSTLHQNRKSTDLCGILSTNYCGCFELNTQIFLSKSSNRFFWT